MMLALMMVGGCATQPASEKSEDIPELDALKSTRIESLSDELDKRKEEGTRIHAIREIGLTIGIQQGRAWRQGQINDQLNKMHDWLSTTWNFEQVMIDGMYLPPRVDEIKGHMEKQDDGSLRVIRHGFRIASEPTLVIETPSYLNYLRQIPDEFEQPNPLGLPQRGTREVPVWEAAVEEGWAIGVKLANREFDMDMSLLRRDYDGMMRYIDLVNRGLLSAPQLHAEKRGVVISADGKSLNVGDEIVTVERTSAFQHPHHWEVLEAAP